MKWCVWNVHRFHYLDMNIPFSNRALSLSPSGTLSETLSSSSWNIIISRMPLEPKGPRLNSQLTMLPLQVPILSTEPLVYLNRPRSQWPAAQFDRNCWRLKFSAQWDNRISNQILTMKCARIKMVTFYSHRGWGRQRGAYAKTTVILQLHF